MALPPSFLCLGVSHLFPVQIQQVAHLLPKLTLIDSKGQTLKGKTNSHKKCIGLCCQQWTDQFRMYVPSTPSDRTHGGPPKVPGMNHTKAQTLQALGIRKAAHQHKMYES
jgi:hypothetical protein